MEEEISENNTQEINLLSLDENAWDDSELIKLFDQQMANYNTTTDNVLLNDTINTDKTPKKEKIAGYSKSKVETKDKRSA